MSVLAVGVTQQVGKTKRSWEQACANQNVLNTTDLNAQPLLGSVTDTLQVNLGSAFVTGNNCVVGVNGGGFLGAKKARHSNVENYLSPCVTAHSQDFEYLRECTNIESALRLLKEKYPQMEEEGLAKTLAVCGNDVEEAIRRIEKLCLAQHDLMQGTPNGAQDTVACKLASTSASNHNLERNQIERQNQQENEISCPQHPAEQQQEQQTRITSNKSTEALEVTCSGEHWVDILVQEMQQAKDLNDARERAKRVLKAFETAVSHQVCGGVSPATMRQQASDLLRDSAILKRALKIQTIKDNEREAEIASLKQQVESFKEQLTRAEMSNYSLAVHLREATTNSSSGIRDRHHPDIF